MLCLSLELHKFTLICCCGRSTAATLLGLLVQSIASTFEHCVLQCQFNEFGAVLLEAETQSLLDQCESILSTIDSSAADSQENARVTASAGAVRVTARAAFRRLQHICLLLNLEQATDVYDTYEYDPMVLSFPEIRRILGRRIDFKPSIIAQLRLEAKLSQSPPEGEKE